MGGNAFVTSVAGANEGRVALRFDGSNVYDTDDGAAFGCGNDTHALAAQVPRDNCNTLGSGTHDDTDVNAEFFGSTFGGEEGPLESGGAGIDGNVLDQDASCAAGAACEGASEALFTIPLHPNAFVPSAVTRADRPIETLLKGTHHTNAGAR